MPAEPLNILVGIVAYNLPHEIPSLVRSIGADAEGVTPGGNRVRCHIYLHSAHRPDVERACHDAEDANPAWVTYHPLKVNRGLSASWNDALIEAFGEVRGAKRGEPGGGWADVCYLPNDDVMLAPGDIDRIARYAYDAEAADPGVAIVTTRGFHSWYAQCPWSAPSDWAARGMWVGMGYSSFCVTRAAWNRIGCFDENIRPCRWEDCDHGMRYDLAGMKAVEVADTRLVHYGSLSWRVDTGLAEQQTGRTDALSVDYFVRKWGGVPPSSVEMRAVMHTEPFGAGAGFGLYIDPANRHAPYGPGYDREDNDWR